MLLGRRLLFSFDRQVMMRGLLLLMLSGWVAASMGCAMCCAPHDEDYSAFGGIHERQDRRYGRVGSVFAPADGSAPIQGAAMQGEIIEGSVEGEYIEGESVLQGPIPHADGVMPAGPGMSGDAEYYEYGAY